MDWMPDPDVRPVHADVVLVLLVQASVLADLITDQQLCKDYTWGSASETFYF